MFRTWFLTVFSEMNSCSPISRDVRPSAIHCRISTSRPVSDGRRVALRSRFFNRWATISKSLLPIAGETTAPPSTTSRMAATSLGNEVSLTMYPTAPALMAASRSSSDSLEVSKHHFGLGRGVDDLVDHFETGDSWHQDVEHDQLGLVAPGLGDRRHGIGGSRHYFEALLLERGGKARLKEGGVVDYKDGWVLHTGSIKPRRPSRRR